MATKKAEATSWPTREDLRVLRTALRDATETRDNRASELNAIREREGVVKKQWEEASVALRAAEHDFKLAALTTVQVDYLVALRDGKPIAKDPSKSVCYLLSRLGLVRVGHRQRWGGGRPYLEAIQPAGIEYLTRRGR